MDNIETIYDLKQHCKEQIKKHYKVNEHTLILDLITGFELLRETMHGNINCTLSSLCFKKCTCKKPNDITPQKIVDCNEEYDKWLNKIANPEV